MKIGLIIRMACLLAAVWLPAACSLMNRSAQEPIKTYLLQGEPTVRPAAHAESARPCLGLRVNEPDAAPGFTTSRMAYVTDSPRLDYFARNAWADTPARMLGALIESRLDSSGMFGAVLAASSDVRTDLRLDTRLQRLVQEFEDDHSRVVLTIKVDVVEVSSRSMLGSRTFSYSEPAQAANPESGAIAANRAAEQFVGDLTEFLQELTASRECRPSLRYGDSLLN